MDLESAKNLIAARLTGRKRRLAPARTAERYYRCENDITRKTSLRLTGRPFSRREHRIASNFFRVLVDQKTSYLVSDPPAIDVGDKSRNDAIKKALGEEWGKKLKQLVRKFSVDGESWLQWWRKEEGGFGYGVLSVFDFEPVWGGPLGEELVLGLKFCPDWVDPETGDVYDTYEIWDRTNLYAYRTEAGAGVDTLEEDRRFKSMDPDFDAFTNTWAHGYGEVPFIRFRNNGEGMGDLVGIKEKIDSYDESMSGLADDIADAEEVIFILSGYGDQDPQEFWENLAENRIIKIMANPLNDDARGTGVETLAVEPPIEARRFNLETTRKAIFEQGGGVDPTPEVLGNTSGEALKHMYNLLELKAAAAEDECRIGLSRLTRAVCRVLGLKEPENGEVSQTWKRTRINNDTELVANVRNSVGILSNRTILKNHPYVRDVDEELKQIEQERREAEARFEEAATAPLIEGANEEQGS